MLLAEKNVYSVRFRARGCKYYPRTDTECADKKVCADSMLPVFVVRKETAFGYLKGIR